MIDQFMRPYQEEAKYFGDAADVVTHVLAQLSKLIDVARDPLRSNDTSNKARARSQSATPRPLQSGPSKQSAHDASKIPAGFRSNERHNREREFEQDHARDKRRGRHGEEDDEFHTSSTGRRASSSRLPRQNCYRNEGTQARNPQSALQRRTETVEYKQRRVESEMPNCNRRILARSSRGVHDDIIQEKRRKLKCIEDSTAV